MKNNEIIIFENQNVKLEVNMKDETVWLTQAQMANLFGKDRKTITRHIQNIYKDGELEENSVCSFFEHTAKDGKNYNTQYYNLDMIISVGYRVKSQNGIIFRRWANKILKDYLLKGYAINQKRLDYLEKTVKLIDIADRIDDRLEGNDAKEILKVISSYSKALDLLDDYDHKTLKKPKGNINNKLINYEECINIINTLKFGMASNLFGVERDKGLESIINNIYQTFDNKDIYPTIEEKSANFLYLIVKNHVLLTVIKELPQLCLFIF